MRELQNIKRFMLGFIVLAIILISIALSLPKTFRENNESWIFGIITGLIVTAIFQLTVTYISYQHKKATILKEYWICYMGIVRHLKLFETWFEKDDCTKSVIKSLYEAYYKDNSCISPKILRNNLNLFMHRDTLDFELLEQEYPNLKGMYVIFNDNIIIRIGLFFNKICKYHNSYKLSNDKIIREEILSDINELLKNIKPMAENLEKAYNKAIGEVV